jgi:hypothetical protein
MRFSLDEVLAGMLATVEADHFADDPARLAALIERLAGQFTLLAPLAQGVDATALGNALATLEQRKCIEHADGTYTLSAEGRAQCVGSKRTLFNQQDREQLEEAARQFATL